MTSDDTMARFLLEATGETKNGTPTKKAQTTCPLCGREWMRTSYLTCHNHPKRGQAWTWSRIWACPTCWATIYNPGDARCPICNLPSAKAATCPACVAKWKCSICGTTDPKKRRKPWARCTTCDRAYWRAQKLRGWPTDLRSLRMRLRVSQLLLGWSRDEVGVNGKDQLESGDKYRDCCTGPAIWRRLRAGSAMPLRRAARRVRRIRGLSVVRRRRGGPKRPCGCHALGRHLKSCALSVNHRARATLAAP